MKGKIKNLWIDLDKDEKRFYKMILGSIVAVIVMKLLDFVFSDITIFMLIAWVIYMGMRINGLKEEKEELQKKISKFIDTTDHYVEELKEKITKSENENKK